MRENSDREIRHYKFELGNTIVMEKGGLWYQRDQEKHTWIRNQAWMARYYDAQYDVIEIDYDEDNELAYAPRAIAGCFSLTQENLISLTKSKNESEQR